MAIETDQPTTSALSVLLPGFEGPTLPPWLEQRLREGLAGVCLFADNVGSPEQLRALTDAVHAANPSAIVAVDEEGGDVSRLHHAGGSPFPGNAVLGRLDDPVTTEYVGAWVGREVREAGIDLTFAPVADVNAEPRNPVIGVRSFGTDPGLVASHAAAWVRGVQAAGVAGCAKHFPGHGDTAEDSHHALPVVHADAATVRSRDLVPFEAAIAAGVATIMSSHVVVPALDPDEPATFSRRLLRDLLREELGFDGVVVSDALDMAGASGETGVPAAAVRAAVGGCDLLCLGQATGEQGVDDVVAAIDEAVSSGMLAADELAAASARVARLGTSAAAARAPLPAGASRYGVAAAVDGADRGAADGGGVRDTWTLAPDDVVAAIDVTDRARQVLAEAETVAWVRLEADANVAVGDGTWGPFLLDVEPVATITGPDDVAQAVAGVPAGATVVAVGRDLHRHPVAEDAVAALRASHPTVVVEMGWHDPVSGLVDVATHGASRLMARALMHVVGDGVATVR